MRRKKGFTLMEVTIVLTIVAILIAILVPSWTYYLQRSRIKSQNAKAKVIFNAAQTVITDLEFYERHNLSNYYDAADAHTQAVAKSRLYTNVLSSSNEWYFYWDGVNGYLCDVNSDPVTDTSRADTINTWNSKITRSINKIARSDEVFRIYIKDYTVASVVSARRENDQYLGSHPVTLDERRAAGVDSRSDVKTKRQSGIKGVTMTEFELGSI